MERERAVYAVRAPADADVLPGDSQVIFEHEVPIHTKHLEREEACQPLVVCITRGHGGPNGTSRYVGFRLTDPRDHFFLFTMTLLEDEYGRFKEKHELNVDFTGFPNDLVAMLEKIAAGGSQYTLVFLVDSAQSGTLRFLERTGFRSLEYLSLQLTKQGDVGQKRYLAERCQHFEAAYHRSTLEKQELDQRQSRIIGDLRRDLDALKAERDELRQRLRVNATEAESSRISAVASVKDELNNEIKRMQSQMDVDRLEQQRKHEAQVAQLAGDLWAKDREVSDLKQRLQQTDSSLQGATAEIRTLQESKRNVENENERLIKDNNELLSFRHAATKTMSESELKHVSMTERLSHFSASLHDKDEELRALKQHAEHQEHYARMLKDQLEAATEKAQKAEAGLSKSHHIIGSQMQALRVGKERQAALTAQVHANEATLSEKTTQIERLKSELSMSTDRVDMYQQKVSDLKEQLLKSEDQIQKLQSQLKQNEDALTHLSRVTHGVTARSWPAVPAPAPPLVGSVPFTVPPNLYSEFRKNLPPPSASFSAGNTSISRPGGNSSVDDTQQRPFSAVRTPVQDSKASEVSGYSSQRQPASSYFPALQAA